MRFGPPTGVTRMTRQSKKVVLQVEMANVIDYKDNCDQA